MGVVMMWLVQMQCILQIIANRLAVLLPSWRDERNLKLGLFLLMMLLTVSVSIVWMPARLQISPRAVLINNIWDRASKALFLAVDLSLNFYFLQTVHRRLISNGLLQYRLLFRVNVLMILIGVAMDVRSFFFFFFFFFPLLLPRLGRGGKQPFPLLPSLVRTELLTLCAHRLALSASCR